MTRRGEVAALVDGPFAHRTYYRGELEAMQQASRARDYPDDHPSAVLRGYQVTAGYEPFAGPDSERPTRRWRYRHPAQTSTPGPTWRRSS